MVKSMEMCENHDIKNEKRQRATIRARTKHISKNNTKKIIKDKQKTEKCEEEQEKKEDLMDKI